MTPIQIIESDQLEARRYFIVSSTRINAASTQSVHKFWAYISSTGSNNWMGWKRRRQDIVSFSKNGHIDWQIEKSDQRGGVFPLRPLIRKKAHSFLFDCFSFLLSCCHCKTMKEVKKRQWPLRPEELDPITAFNNSTGVLLVLTHACQYITVHTWAIRRKKSYLILSLQTFP